MFLKTESRNVIWQPQRKQALFMERSEDEALYGGAAGGGKSDALIIEATRQVHIPHYKALILRRTAPQLAELIEKSHRYYPRAFPKASYLSSARTWRFPSGARIVFGTMQHAKDKTNYQGQAYDFIAFDELTHFTYDEYVYLRSRNRPNGEGTRCYIRATGNPGGIGHGWVKDRFITAAPPMTPITEEIEIERPDGTRSVETRSRIFVPSTVFDNEILLRNDPGYLTRLGSLPEAERRALLYGDWESYSGQFFAEWRDMPEHYGDRRWTHVIDPFEIPDHWRIYRSFDWGYNRPFSCGWWAVDHDGVAYRILELYGCTGTPNEGVRWTAQKVFEEIAKIEREHRWLKGKNISGVADPAIFAHDGGESIADTAMRSRVYFSPGDNQRLPGWMQMHYRLSFDDKGYPMMYIFKNCRSFIRTVPTLVYDEVRVEDLNTEGEDHIADEARYFCMARPIAPKREEKEKGMGQDPKALFLDVRREDISGYAKRARVRFDIEKNQSS